MLPRSTVKRTPRELAKGRPSGRTHEIQRLIGRSLRAVIDTAALGERTVILDCDVLQADGGTRTAAITGAFVALAMALQQLRQFKVITRKPLLDYLAATSVGIVGGTPMIDLCYEEDSQADVDMNVVMTGAGRFIELQATAEHQPFDDAQMAQLIGMARSGIGELIAEQKRVVKLD
jgi:ribonuclease PH